MRLTLVIDRSARQGRVQRIEREEIVVLTSRVGRALPLIAKGEGIAGLEYIKREAHREGGVDLFRGAMGGVLRIEARVLDIVAQRGDRVVEACARRGARGAVPADR